MQETCPNAEVCARYRNDKDGIDIEHLDPDSPYSSASYRAAIMRRVALVVSRERLPAEACAECPANEALAD